MNLLEPEEVERFARDIARRVGEVAARHANVMPLESLEHLLTVTAAFVRGCRLRDEQMLLRTAAAVDQLILALTEMYQKLDGGKS